MQNTQFTKTVAITNAVTNMLNPATLTGGVNAPFANTYMLIKHIRVVNKTGGAVTFSMFKGATGASAAGTEIVGSSLSVPANSYVDFYGLIRLDVADFLTASASANTSLVAEFDGEIGVTP
jgi:hypothetical protein